MTDKNPHLTTPSAILCFPHLDKPSAPAKNAEPRYSAMLLFDVPNFTEADKKYYRQLRKVGMDAFIKKFGDDEDIVIDRVKCQLAEGYRWPIRPATEKKKYEAFTKGRTYLSLGSLNPPPLGRVVAGSDGKHKVQKVDFSNELFYPGARVRAKVSPWAFDNVSKGLRFNLEGLVFLGHGERLGGGAPAIEDQFADDDFEDVSDLIDATDDDIEDGIDDLV